MKTPIAALGGILALALGGAALADYPERAITLIVPYSPGGGGDTVARIVADRLAAELGQTINVVNRQGAGGEIGIAEMAAADADGYTLGVFGYPDNFVLSQTRETEFGGDSFEYLASFDAMPMGIFASPASAFSSLDALKEYGEANPGALVVGQSGALGLLNILAFADGLGIEVTPLNYGGGGELMNGLLGNHIDLASTSSMSHDNIVGAGGAPIGFAAGDRMAMFPDVPTFEEQGLPLDMGVSRVLVAPAGIPSDVRERLVAALDAISGDADMIARFETASLPYRYLGADATAEMVARSNAAYAEVIERNAEHFQQ
ncbi:tripartite tricarboxylate transporter substrate binding protein [Rubrimonas sp.]|uniref:tripartite tricarboxylate transporter substrate binding protein n=1 Tax=Rubrimonas sp. TaxID=2036015 RepID=UPI002FDEF26D